MAENAEMTDDSKGFVSERGPFEIFENPPMNAPFPSEAVKKSRSDKKSARWLKPFRRA